MEASLVFLGTGGGHLITSRQLLATGGIVLSLEGHQIHIDPGPGTLIRAKQHGIDLERTSILLGSSEALERTNDLPMLADVMTSYGAKKRGIYIGNKGVSEKLAGKNLAEIHALEAGKHLDLDGLRIAALIATNHNIGLKIISSKLTVGYTSATEYSSDMAKQLENTDILILDVAAPFKYRIEGRLNSDDAVKMIDRVKPRLAIITGFHPEMIEANPIYEAREIQRQTGVQVIAAHDGLKIDPMSYSAASGQRKLSGF